MENLIEELKAKFGKIITVEIPLDEDDETKVAVFYLKRPDKITRKMISKLALGELPEKAVLAGYNALRVGGDAVSILENNYEAFISAEDALVDILKVQKATIKKN